MFSDTFSESAVIEIRLRTVRGQCKGYQMKTALAIALGGAIGAVMRHFLNNGIVTWAGSAFPWGIMAVNIIGSLVMGLLAGWFAQFHDPGQTMRAFLTVGVLGGFTTFSSFSLNAIELIERGAVAQAAAYVGASVFLSLFGLAAGLMLMRSVAP
jgi:CrcB protein